MTIVIVMMVRVREWGRFEVLWDSGIRAGEPVKAAIRETSWGVVWPETWSMSEFSWWIGKGVLENTCKLKSVSEDSQVGYDGEGSKIREAWTMKQRWAEKQVSSLLFFKVWNCLKGAGKWPKDVNLGRNITMFAFKKALWSVFLRRKLMSSPYLQERG